MLTIKTGVSEYIAVICKCKSLMILNYKNLTCVILFYDVCVHHWIVFLQDRSVTATPN